VEGAVDYRRPAKRAMSEPVRVPPLATRDVGARGVRVRFYEGGSGAPVLLVHGYLWSGTVWGDVFPLLAQSLRVIVPDLPGFGESEKPSPARYAYGLEAFVESLVDLIATLGVGRVSVCGHSMGGAVALMLAAQHPDLVEKLILVDPIVYGSRRGTAVSIATLPILGPLLFKQMYGKAMFRRFFRDNVYAREESLPVERLDQMFTVFNAPAAREAAYATMLATLDTRALVASIPRVLAPTLVAWGRSDKSVPVESGRRLARELRRARFEVFDCGHSPPEETPREFAEVASAFLRGKAAP
jgi:pimeloyl-ACP methyl ester carboxylesterase